MINENAGGGTAACLVQPAPRYGTWSQPTIGKKLGLIFALLLALTYANLHHAITLFGNLDNSAHIVNETGKLRYMSQRIAFLATRFNQDDRRRLVTQIRDFNRTLDGIETYLDSNGNRLQEQAPEITGQLGELRSLLGNYAVKVSMLIASENHLPNFRKAQAELHAASDPMFAVADGIVGALTEADRKVRKQVHKQIDAVLIIEGLFLLLVFVLIQRGVSRPIRKLARLCHDFAAGNHSLRMKFDSRDEVGDLSHSFNRTAEITSALILAQNRLTAILEKTTDLVASFHPDGSVFYLNAAARRLFGIGSGATGNIADHYPEWARSIQQHAALPAALHDGFWTGELAVLDAAGTEIPVSQTLIVHHDAAGAVDFFSFIARDISENKRVAAQLERLANHDSLTGLPNRNLLTDRLSQALVFARRQEYQAAVMFLDLDRFKTVNDTLGHEAGDRLLVVVAERLKACLREGDTVARIGGDEFIIVLPNIGNDDIGRINSVAEKLLHSLAAPIQIDEHDLFVSASLGISVYPRDGEDAATLLKHADVAMYRAKDEGRANHQFFAPDMNTRALERLSIENHLRRALDNNEFVLHYQPQVETASGRIVGMEALVRWQSPTLGLVSPADFIPLAEETGLIVPIGEWVLHTACAQNRAWQDAGLPPVRVAVNLSPRQFRQHDVVKLVADTLTATGLDGKYLDLELTEGMLMDDQERIIATLRQLKALGVRIALDDFGTGYSSLSYLKRFPIDEIKIDKSFVRDLAENSEDAAIVRAILGITRGLTLGSVAEGVETPAQQNYLQEQECERMQGYLFGRPVTADEVAVLLAATGHGDCGTNIRN